MVSSSNCNGNPRLSLPCAPSPHSNQSKTNKPNQTKPNQNYRHDVILILILIHDATTNDYFVNPKHNNCLQSGIRPSAALRGNQQIHFLPRRRPPTPAATRRQPEPKPRRRLPKHRPLCRPSPVLRLSMALRTPSQRTIGSHRPAPPRKAGRVPLLLHLHRREKGQSRTISQEDCGAPRALRRYLSRHLFASG